MAIDVLLEFFVSFEILVNPAEKLINSFIPDIVIAKITACPINRCFSFTEARDCDKAC